MPPKKSKRGRKRGRSSERKTTVNKKKKRATSVKPKSSFPIQAIHQLMEQKFSGGTVKPEAAIFLSAVMEYVAAELIELTLNAARSRQADTAVIRLTAPDVETAIESDAELSELMNKVRPRQGP